MNEELEHEDELIRLSEIFETLKKDALEVSDLLVKGIEFHKAIGYLAICLGLLSFSIMWIFIPEADLFTRILYFFLFLVSVAGGIYGLYKYRRLKKKYAELIEIQKSLAE